MEETIDLQDIFNVMKQRFLLILTCAFLGLGISSIATYFFITPTYKSSAQLIVTLPAGEGSDASLSDVNFNLLMINTYKDFIKKGSLVMDTAREELQKTVGFTGSTGALNSMVSVSQEQNSQMFSIIATAENPKEAADIANVVARVFQEKARDVLDVDKISIVAEATPNSQPISPNNKLNILIGLVLGVLIGIGLAFLLEAMDKTLKKDSFLTDDLELILLGTVSEMKKEEMHGGLSPSSSHSINKRKRKKRPSEKNMSK